MSVEELTKIFNEWAKRYSENPEEFTKDILDEEGKPVEDYGQRCAVFFTQLKNELN